MKNHKHVIILLSVLVMLLSIAGLSAVAQSGTNADLRIAFVSNRRGNDDIFLMTQNGESDPVSNLTNNPARDWNPAWSPGGDKIIFNSDRDQRDTLYIMNADGTAVQPLFVGETFNDYDAAWSPDGTLIAFTSDRNGGGRELFICNSDGSNVQALTDSGTLKGDPAWSPDGTELVYWELENTGEIQMYRRPIASDGVQLITSVGPANGAPVWFGDDIFFDSNRDGMWYIYRMKSDGAQPQEISTLKVNSGRATIAPDGSLLAFVTDRDNSDEIYTMTPDGKALRRLTDNAFSDNSPAWQPKVPDNQLPTPTPVQVTEEPTVEAPSDGGEVDLSGLVNSSVSGVTIHPISEQQMLIDYGIQAWHEAGWTGAGQRVGIIDTGFGGLKAFQDRTGEVSIPPDDRLGDYNADQITHGTEVLEIVRTVAPNADLYACRYQGTVANLRKCADWMVARGVKIINHSVGLPVLPLDGQSEWAQFANSMFQQDVLWVNSAGNFNRGYISGNYQDTNNDGYHDFIFGTGLPRPVTVSASPDDPYTGTVLLSWKDAAAPLYDEQTGTYQRVNLDLEIVSHDTEQVIASSEGNQGLDGSLPLFEIANLSNVQEPFDIRIKNAGLNFQENIEYAVFVEFAPLPDDIRSQKGSVIAPADARNVITVASVDGNRELASYSSRGLEITQYQKPDIAAPGEIILPNVEPFNGEPFVGTSAASPVVAGIAALLMEQDPALTVDQLPRQLTQVFVVPKDDRAYGAGIIQLGAPRSTRLDIGVVNTSPYTVFPRPDEQFVDEGFSCRTKLVSRLEPNIPGYVNFDLGLTIRKGPSGSAGDLDTLFFGTQFEVVSGPKCAEAAAWWEVKLDTGAIGWLSEGLDYYLLAPVSLERAQQPRRNIDCPNTLTPQLDIGMRGRLLQSGMFFFRSVGAKYQMDPLVAGTIVEVLDGPVCEGKNGNVLRWYVRVVEGDRTGYEGWVSEGDTDTRLIVPLSDS